MKQVIKCKICSTQVNEMWKEVDLSSLTTEQRTIAEKMLKEESDSFATEGEIGSMEEVQMKIQLNDTTPVQHKYRPMARPLYEEIKAYVQDLLNHNIITKSETLRKKITLLEQENEDLKSKIIEYEEEYEEEEEEQTENDGLS